MSYLPFIIVITVVIAGIVGVFMIVESILTWLHLKLVEKHSIETTALILHVEVMDKNNRHVPFVKIQIEVNANTEQCFITKAESFFPKHKLSTLTTGKAILIRYNPLNISQVQVIKETLPVNEKVNTWEPLVKKSRYQYLN